MRIVIALEVQEGFDYEQTLALARLADDYRVAGFMLAEHYCSAGAPNTPVLSPDAWIYLGALARETRHLRLGTLVSPVTFRHPAIYAKMAATLDLISGGRAELGLGAGWLADEHDAYGFPFPDGPTRVSILAEQLEIISGLWSLDTFSFEGRHYTIRSCSFTPRCVQRPRVPILVGGRPTSQRLLSLAARFADEYVLTRGSLDDCERVKQALASRSIGKRILPNPIRLGLFVRLALHGNRNASPYIGKDFPNESNEGWVVGTRQAVLARLLQLREIGVNSLYISAETFHHVEDVVNIIQMIDRQ